MIYAPTVRGGYGEGSSPLQVGSAHPNLGIVLDAELLFTANFRRAGPDLILTGQDGRHHSIPGYFSTEQRSALTAPNGASLSPSLVELLAGSPAPNQYAQAQPTGSAASIGAVEKVVGNVTVVRNGVAVALNVGDKVYKSDIVQTAANSAGWDQFSRWHGAQSRRQYADGAQRFHLRRERDIRQ